MRPAPTLLVVVIALGCTPAPAPSAPTTPAATRSEPVAAVTASPSPSPPTPRPAARPVQLGGISGRLAYPSDFVPALSLFAVRVDGPTSYRLLHTSRVPPGAPAYTMAAVEPGTYTVVAYAQGLGEAAGTAAVSCGLRASCTDHSLVRVTMRGGETTSGVDVSDWYAPPGTFPARPAGSDPFSSGQTMRVCNPYSDSLNVRASAGLGFPVRRTLDNGVSVVVRDGPLPADGYDWYEVHLAGDPLANGWVVAYALRK